MLPQIATGDCLAHIRPAKASQLVTCCEQEMTCIRGVARCVHAAAKTWSVVQVELHGQYSLERMRRFHAYSTTTSWVRILFWCILTPIPCFLANTLQDIPPLAKPSAGREANYVFWTRATVGTFIITFAVLMQIGFLVPGLGMTHRHAAWITTVVTVGCTAYSYILAGFIPNPIPFMFISATPMFSLTCFTMVAIFFGRKLRNDVDLRESSIRAMNAISLQFGLTFIYPIFIYGFNSIPAKYQTPYMTFIVVIKIAAKNIMSKMVVSNDMRPETLVFCIDAFHAVYVSLAMQSATTISTSLFVMLIDIAQGCVSVYDVYEEFQPLKRFMNKIPAGHALHGKNFLEVAIALDQRGLKSNVQERLVKRTSLNHGGPKSGTFQSVRVLPETPFREHTSNTPSVAAFTELGSENERERFLLSTRKLLFTTEVVTLIEYSEGSCQFSAVRLFTAATYYLPNRAFYTILTNMDDYKLWHAVVSVLMYAGLELLSLVGMELVLRRITGVSAMRQVGFVLDTQCIMVQSRFFAWVVYAVQNSLEHAGADFTFQFKWLRSDRTPSS